MTSNAPVETTLSHLPSVSPTMETTTAEYGVDEICARLGISRATFYRLRQANVIPAPLVKRYPPVCIWTADVVEQLVAQLAKRD